MRPCTEFEFGAAKALLLGLFFQFPISGQSWVQVSPIGTLPPARYYHSTVHDSVTNRLIVFGGIGNSGMLGDIWSLNLSGTPVWTQLSAGTGPGVRSSHSAVFDPGNSRM